VYVGRTDGLALQRCDCMRFFVCRQRYNG